MFLLANVYETEQVYLHVDLIWCYKIVFNLECLNCEDFFEYCPVSTMRGHPYKLYKKHCNSNVRRNRVIDVWNSLPLTVDFSNFTVLSILQNGLISNSFLSLTSMLHVLYVSCVFNLFLLKSSSKRGFVPCCPVQKCISFITTLSLICVLLLNN